MDPIWGPINRGRAFCRPPLPSPQNGQATEIAHPRPSTPRPAPTSLPPPLPSCRADPKKVKPAHHRWRVFYFHRPAARGRAADLETAAGAPYRARNRGGIGEADEPPN